MSLSRKTVLITAIIFSICFFAFGEVGEDAFPFSENGRIRRKIRKRAETSIVATLGPASNTIETLSDLIYAGADIFRLNFSHGKDEEKIALVELIRQAAKAEGREVHIMADLQGPKVRISKFKNGKEHLNKGDRFILDASLDSDAGDENIVGVDYKELPDSVKAGDILLLDDGRLLFSVEEVNPPQIICKILIGGTLKNNKGINIKGGGLSAGALTDKDREDLKTAVRMGADMIAISFVLSEEDVFETRELIRDAGGSERVAVVAKIERAELVIPENLERIVEASDGVIVARGDLGCEIGFSRVPAAQKLIIETANKLDKFVFTATQMMETMIDNKIPTRAEVSDVFNAVLDGTHSVMLSAETATGGYPVKAVKLMSDVCIEAEEYMKKSGEWEASPSLFPPSHQEEKCSS